METACLRIRFTPLLKDIKREDSKHCVEIVPEISYIQNFEKIQWRKEENSIEYTIPMTYKIILRKKETIKESFHEVEALNNTYHSCVDLLLPSSDMTLSREPLGSGDINRILSDTFVLSKVTTDVERCSIILRGTDDLNKIDDSIELTTAQVQTEVYSNPSITSQLIYNEIIESAYRKTKETAVTQTPSEVVQSKSVIQVSDTDIFDRIKSSIDKITNTELINSNPCMNVVRALETVTRVFSNNSKTEAKQQLSLSPICSVNTQEDESMPVAKGFSNKIVFRVYESPNCFFNRQNEDNNIRNSDFICDLFNIQNQPQKQYEYVNSHKIKPEIRVANFIQIMENEIMPLKLMLSDIINKCSTLGVMCKKPQQSPVIYKKITNGNKEISRCCKTVKESKSNRVVYSVVFDG